MFSSDSLKSIYSQLKMDEAKEKCARLLELLNDSNNRDLHEYIRKEASRLHAVAKKICATRDGHERHGRKYTDEENHILSEHVVDFLIRGEYPDFEYISDHMYRTPEALEEHTQKLFTVYSNWSWTDLVKWYGITPQEAQKLTAPQHFRYSLPNH